MENKKIDLHNIQKRNKRIIEFFKAKNFKVKLLGNENSPAIIFADDVCLSCYVKNFYLIFMSKPFDGKELFRIKLSHIVSNEFDKQFIDWIENANHRAVYIIYFELNKNNGYMYIVGFNKNENNETFPVFAKQNPKIYFTLESAKSIIKDFSKDFPNLKVSNDEL
jgi:hypothetical protein